MSEQLSALDATFLELEEADQSAHMHIGAVVLIDGGPDGGAPPIETVRRDVGRRLPDLPRFGQRLSSPATGGLRWPDWEPDPNFDVAHHVFRAGLPAPAGREQLLAWAGDYYSHRLDRARPLWELVTLDLGDGGWALVTKTHHAMVDGVGSVDIGRTLLDSEPLAPSPDSAGGSGPHGEPGPSRAGEVPPGALRRSAARLAAPGLSVGRAAIRLGQAGLGAVEAAVGIAAHPGRARAALDRSRALAELIVRDELAAAPHTSLNEPIGAKRRLSVFDAELDELRAIRRELGGTVNDVVLAAATGGLRRLLLHRGEEPPAQGIRAMVPVNVRTAGESLTLGNRISSLFVHLPVATSDPRRRYEQQLDEAESLKSGNQATGSTTLIDVASRMPPVLHSFIARALFATRLFNVTITNVPGPQTPLYCFGSRVREIWPLVPIAAEHAVGLAVFSYDGRLFFCVNADRDTCEDLDVLSEGIQRSLAELRELAGAAA